MGSGVFTVELHELEYAEAMWVAELGVSVYAYVVARALARVFFTIAMSCAPALSIGLSSDLMP